MVEWEVWFQDNHTIPKFTVNLQKIITSRVSKIHTIGGKFSYAGCQVKGRVKKSRKIGIHNAQK